jgi:23S rRNA (adenine2503-C2)-methyltransferase
MGNRPADSAGADACERLVHGQSRDEVRAFCKEQNQPLYRAGQIWHWLYGRRIANWEEASNLPRPLLTALAGRFTLNSAAIADVRGDPDGTRKLLVRLADGDAVETVLIPAADRRTVCVSTQVGCAEHCAFCASGQAGLRRNLSAGEIVGQVLLAWTAYGDRPTHLVFMGIGEPFDNYDAVLKAVRIVNDHSGINLGARRITLSTCGVIPGIERLMDEGLQVELSVSLHAADDDLRSRLLPVNRRYPLDALLTACRAYTGKTGRMITFEYTLIRGTNDTPEHARRLVARLAGWSCRVNLIPLSPVREFNGAAPAAETCRGFMDLIVRAGINATLRASRGGAVRAACGQLRFAPPAAVATGVP